MLCPVVSRAAISEAPAAALQNNSRTVTLSVKNALVTDILQKIKEQTGANFVANTNIIESLGRRSIDISGATLAEVMSELLKGTGYQYRVTGNNVTIVPAPESQSAPKTVSLSGTVSDIAGKPIAGVTVTIKGTTRGVATDHMGQYTIPVAEGQTIVFSFVGMKSLEIVFGSQQELNVTMEELPYQVDEVVVTGMFRKSAESFTGSVVTVTSTELEQFGSRNIMSTLRNIDPSFNIIENNSYGSDPNRLPDIQIRGSSSIPNIDELQDNARTQLNTPLIIIDGFEASLRTLMDMNDNEIALITLLKDASATAMYGSRGANGVIVIETKVPQSGKLRITYRANLDMEMPDLSSYNLMTAREKLEFEKKAGVFGGDTDISLRQQYNYLLSQVNNGVNTDWLAQPLRVGIGHRHNLRIEGGDKVFRYSASAQYDKTTGVMKRSERENFNGTITLVYSLKNLRFSNYTLIGLNNTSDSPYGTFSEYALMNPYFAPYSTHGRLIKTLGLDGEGASTRWGSGIANPLWNSTLNTYDKTNSTTITNNFSIDWNILDGLILRGKLGVSKIIGGSDAFYPAEHTRFKDYSQEDILSRGQYHYGNSRAVNLDASLNLNYSHTFAEKHQIYAGFNFNARQNTDNSAMIMAEGFVNQDMDMLAMALQYAEGGKPSGSESKSRAVGIAANVNYSFDNRYYADFTLTGDGNSAFGSNKRFASFWSAGFGWNIHNEAFFGDNAQVDRLKLRFSMGTSGSQSFSAYQALTTYRYYTDSNYFMWLGADVNRLGNPDLKWQQKMNYNFGLDADFFQRRLMATLDIYQETTRDQISSVTIPSSTGFTSYIDNIGKIENRGFELKLTGVVVRNTDRRLMWSVTGSIIHNKNRIKTLSAALKKSQESIEADNGSNPYVIYREGHSMDAIWVVPSLGIDPSTGKELYRDKDGKPTWQWNAADLADCGISQPKYQGNINTNLRWGNFQFAASFGYRFGGQVYNTTLINKVENTDYKNNLDRRVGQDRWQQPGDKAMYKGINVTERTKKTSRFIQNERMLRCQSLSLIYDFNKELIRKWHMENLQLQVSMDDIFYASSVKRERGTTYPFSRLLSFSLNVTF